MMLVSTPTKHCIQPRSPSCDSSMPQYYSRNRNCTPPRFASESSPFGSPVLTPSPLRQRPLFPTTAGSMQDSDDLFVQPSGHPASPNPLAPSPQPIAADDDEGSIFLSSGPSPFAAAFISQPLLTPARQSHRPLNRTALGLRNLNAGLSSTELLPSTSLDSGSRIGLGTKRKSTTHNTPLRHHNLTPLKVALSASDDRDKSAFLFDRLAPLPTPKTNARTPQTKAETDLYLRRQTATLTRLRISDRGDSGDEFNDDANDSGCEIDEDEANTLFLSNARMKNKVPSLGKSAGRVLSSKSKSKEEVAEAISPGGHVTKRRARSRPVSTELKQSVRSPKSPSRSFKIFYIHLRVQVLTTGSNATRPKIRSTVSFPSTHTRSPSSSSTSEAGSPVRRRRTNAVAAHMSPPSKLPEPPLPPRPPLSRLESVSSATLFFGPPIPQNPAPASIRSRTNTLISMTSPDLAVKASTKGKTKRHSYTGLDDLRAWNTIQARLPSPVSSPDNASFVNTDIDDDMDFDDYPPNSSLVLNVMANTPSPLTKTTLQTKYKPRDSGVVVSDDNGGIAFANTKSLEGGHFLFPIAQSSTSVSSNFSDNDEGLVTPGVAPDSGSCWSDTNIFIRGTDDNGRTSHGSLEGGVDVDAFIMKTLASAANGPHEVMKKVPGTPVKRSRTTFLAGDRPWQSAVASKVGPRLDFNEKKAPRKSLPAVFPVIPRHGDQSIDSSDSEGEQDSPSSRKEPKYGNLGLGRPSATDVPLALTRTRWLMRRSSSGAFSSGSESASLSTTPTRNKATGETEPVDMIDWQLPKPRIPAMFSQAPQLSFKPTSARSASGSSNSSTVTISPTDRSRHLAISGSRCTVPRARSATGRSSEFTAEEQSGRFGREFVELAEVGCGEFGKVIKVRRKTGDDSEVCAIKKSKRFEGARHRLRLREEVDILKHLSQTALDCGFNGRHPNVLAYIDSWEEDEQLFIQTELCESGNLARFLWEYGRVFPRLDEARVWKIIADLSNGLRFIHDAGIIHLDLKPSNVFLTKEGRFKIGDFGMASAWPRPSTEDGSGLGGGSLERGAFEREGDKLYLAPEVLQGRYGKEVDVFSLGMTILETASNIVVPDQGEAWHRLRREDFSQVDLEEESGELLGLIKQMMRVDPASRINARGICDHPVVARARGAMERMMGDARRDGKPEFVGSPLASVPPGFLEEILGRGRDGGWEMDMSA
ncbi:Mitosis inhibitor protein kinase wee1 [Leucoagaricus sp. SymC.cos]|nr:Mitosis inhibitor protein kinase wee1 [Leucoagaricus sp. SymC.cos]